MLAQRRRLLYLRTAAYAFSPEKVFEKGSYMKSLFLIISLTLLLLICSGPLAAQSQEQWSSYTAPGEEFTVSVPSTLYGHVKLRPKFSTSTAPSDDFGFQIGRIYSAYSDGAVYVIMSFGKKSGEKLDDFIKEFKQHYLPQPREMTFVRDVSMPSVIGKHFNIKQGDNGPDGVLHFYITNKHVYMVEVVADHLSNLAVRRFLSTFRLGNDFPAKSAADALGNASDTVQEADSSGDVFTTKQVIRKAIIVARPEAVYTERARMDNIEGTVVLRGIFSSSGQVINLRVVSALPDGLTEGALEAARNLRFIPAVKNGKYVSQYVQIEYNFSLY